MHGRKGNQRQCLIKILDRQTKNIVVFFELANYRNFVTWASFEELLLCSCVKHYKASPLWPVHLMFYSETIPANKKVEHCYVFNNQWYPL